jgi:hypothetical protein
MLARLTPSLLEKPARSRRVAYRLEGAHDDRQADTPYLIHAIGNNITKRKRADKVSAIGLGTPPAGPANFVLDCVDKVGSHSRVARMGI